MVEGRPAGQPSPERRGHSANHMPARPNAYYAISNIGTEFPSHVNRKIVMGRGPRSVRTPSTSADRGVPLGGVIQGHWTKPRVRKISQIASNSHLNGSAPLRRHL